jgi:hypothetical protein
MVNLKYQNAKDRVFIGTSSLNYYTNPNHAYNYSHTPRHIQGCPVGFGGYNALQNKTGDDNGWIRMCYKSPASSTFWNPLINQFIKKPTDKKVINKVYDCCNNKTLGIKAREECGDLWDGGDQGQCRSILEKYCVANPDKIRDSDECKSLINTSEDVKNKLLEICPSKARDGRWDSVCSCYYGYEYYDKLAKKVESEWNGPSGGISRKPECINPKCASNTYRNKSTTCDGVSFTSCVQNTQLNLSDSTIKSLEIKQSEECENAFNKKLKNSNLNDGGGGGDGRNRKPHTGAGSDDTSTRMLLTFIIILLISYYVVIYSNSYDDDDYEYDGGEYYV